MIKTANEIIAIVREADAARQAKVYDATMEFINTTIAEAVEQAAKNCNLYVNVKVSHEFDRDLIKRVLEDAGYEVYTKGYDVRIDWMSKYLKKGLDK